jgi:hypothetical protein
MKIMRITEKFPVDRATRCYFLIPSMLIFWGCAAKPAYVPDSCRIALEEFRVAIKDIL